MTRPARRHSSLLVQCVTYAGLGMPIGMLGAGWPEARSLFGQSSGALGIVAAGYGLGRLVTSPLAVPILRRWHIRTASTAFGAAMAISCAVVGLTRSFPVLVVAFTLVGLLSGALDTLGNRYQTVVRDVGSAGLMFGCFGLGSTLGPAVVATTSWTVGYLLSAIVAATAATMAASRKVAWPDAMAAPEPRPADVAPFRVPRTVVALSLSLFAIYCGIEVVTGNWAASYLEGARGLSSDAAAWAVSGFWAGMTLGRLSMGRLASARRRVDPARLLKVQAVVVLVVYASIPLLPSSAAAVAFALGGLGLAGMFPTLMSTTADRVGVAATGRVMGWQLLVANISATGLSAAVGAGVDVVGDALPGATLAVLAVVGLPLLLRTLAIHPADAPRHDLVVGAAPGGDPST